MEKMNIILGAGPAGLFCAHELKKTGETSLIIEKTARLGGLAASHNIENLGFEVGPHIFQDSDEYVFQIAKSYLKDDFLFKNWVVEQYLDGKLLTFPNDLSNMWKLLGSKKMINFILSYLKYRFIKPKDFQSFIFKKVGKSLADFNVINYTEKMWGIPIDQLEYEWIKPRMDRISIWKIIRSSYHRNTRTFYYPKQGAGQLYNEMGRVQEVKFNEFPTQIFHNNNVIDSIHTNNGKYDVNTVFSSISLDEFINLLNPGPPTEVLKAVLNLKYRSQVYVVLVLDQPEIIKSQWIYFPEKQIPFCRVHAPQMFSDYHNQNDKTILVFEYFCFKDDTIWKETNENIIEETFKEFLKLGIIKDCKIVNASVMKMEKAYPLLDTKRKKNFAIVNNYLSCFTNFFFMGRHGLHTYDNQHEAGRTGVDAVNKWLKEKNN
jgi:protoporphyrinogen oxidase